MSKSAHRSKITRKGQRIREQHQRKICARDEAGKGKKSIRGEPEDYNELKNRLLLVLLQRLKQD